MAESAPTLKPPFKCVVVTPERTVLETNVEFVALPLFDGELGVAFGRAPLVARLSDGELRATTQGGMRRFYVEGGFVQIARNVVTVLTSRAAAAEHIDTDALTKVLQEPLADLTDAAARNKLREQQTRARRQLAIAGRK